MSKWGSEWGSPWGCEGDPPSKVEDICKFWLWWQYQRAPNMQALCSIFTTAFREQESKAQDVQSRRGLEGARGGEVDAWGALVGVTRNGVSDNLLKRKIQAAARASYVQGQARDFYDVMVLIAPNSNPTFAEAFPACVRMFFDAVTAEERLIIFELMREVPALGVCLQFVEVDDPGELFEFSYLESDVGIVPRGTFDIERHWDYFPDLDIPAQQKAGFAYLIE